MLCGLFFGRSMMLFCFSLAASLHQFLDLRVVEGTCRRADYLFEYGRFSLLVVRLFLVLHVSWTETHLYFIIYYWKWETENQGHHPPDKRVREIRPRFMLETSMVWAVLCNLAVHRGQVKQILSQYELRRPLN